MGNPPNRKAKPTSVAAQKKAAVESPNFELVGQSRHIPTTLMDIARYGDVVPVGANTWRVRATFDEWVGRGGDHLVRLQYTGLVCTCRQAWAFQACAHVITVRHLGRVNVKPVIGTQLPLFAMPEPTVRASERAHSRGGARRG